MRVLITRAQPEAAATARIVQEMGFVPIVAPLTRIVALEDGLDAVRKLSAGDARVMVATSIRSIRVLLDAGFEDFVASQRWAVVGRRAADLLGQVGAELFIAPALHISDLITRLPSDVRLDYVCARDRKPDLELAQSFQSVTPVYAAQSLDGFDRKTVLDLQTNGLDCGLVYSARGARLLADAFLHAEMHPLLARAHWFCLSDDVSQALQARSINSLRCEVAQTPTQNALLAVMKEWARS